MCWTSERIFLSSKYSENQTKIDFSLEVDKVRDVNLQLRSIMLKGCIKQTRRM